MEGRSFLEPGTLLDGSYKIVRVVGAGGFGVTYEAVDVNLGTTVALKEYYPEDFSTRTRDYQIRPSSDRHSGTFEWGRSGFLEEARTLARFRHPSIVQVYRIFEANSTAYMVMAFEHGLSLEKWLRGLGRPPSQDELDRLVDPLLDALEVMHANNFLHRDIAPDNIIIRFDNTPVLLDFGAARKTVAAKTHALTGLFKQGYSPQEQYSTDGKFQGPWSDFYALGATLYRAVTGLPPDEAPSRGLHDTLLPAAQAAKGVYRPGFLAGIDACLKVRPTERPQNVSQVRELFHRPGGVPRQTQDGTSSTRTVTRLVASPPRRRGVALALVAVILLAIAGGVGGVIYLARPDAEKQALAEVQKRAEAEAGARGLAEERQRDLEAQRIARERYMAEVAERQRQEERLRRQAEEDQRRLAAEADQRRRREEEERQRQRDEEERQRQARDVAPDTDIATLPLCERLWRQRNAIFHSFGYCFTSGKAISFFGNANCFRNQGQTWQAMGESNRGLIESIQNQERANAC